MDSVVFDREEIIRTVNKLKMNTAPGPDGLPTSLYKNLKYTLAVPLEILFNLIFQCGELPCQWKEAIVKPIFKKGSSSETSNYRPISLTCVCCKVFESILKNHLLDYMQTNSIISKHQHGFLSKHSTTTNLLESLNDWTSSLEHRQFVKILYVDFEKAFDRVSVPKLLHKLQAIGIDGKLFSCLQSFLSRRLQAVRINDVQSDYLPVISGVPQGSVLGPFLFLLFINDLPDIFEGSTKSKLFADDLKAYDSFNAFNVFDSNEKFQNIINQIIKWSDTWQMSLSVSKCGSLLIIGNSNPCDDQELMLNSVSLCNLDSVKDLGVIMDKRLCFAEHVDGVIAKSKQRSYLLFKAFKSREVSLMVFAFKVYILPLLDYCCPVWSPYKLQDIDRLEKVQRSFTKKLHGLNLLNYSERLQACKLPSLELRRLWSDLVVCYKIVHKLVDLDFDDFFELECSRYSTRGHKYKLRIPKIVNCIRKNFFSIRVLPIWNHLSSDIVSAPSAAAFKAMIKVTDFSKFLHRSFDVHTRCDRL